LNSLTCYQEAIELALKRTSLYEVHKSLGAKMTEFAGFEMPLQYTSIIDEHMAVRTKVGMFDVSHMGELHFEGDPEMLNVMVTADVSKLESTHAIYTMLLNEQGGVVDDLILYKLSPFEVLLVVNAANTEKDFNFIKNHLQSADVFENVSDDYFDIAVQGPRAAEVLEQFFPISELKPFEFAAFDNLFVSRTGYTGEDGFEIYGPMDKAPRWWENFMKAGSNFGLKPAGLGARDTLRLEAGLPLYGHELNEKTTPLESNYAFVIDWDKPSFFGKEILLKQKEEGVSKKLMGLEVEGGIAREGYKVFADGEEVGVVTSGTMAPFLKKSIAMAFIRADKAKVGTPVQVDIRGNLVPAKVVSKFFYKRGHSA
jgi:aminomethyltransferase